MSWNYRVVKHIDKGEMWYAIHEAYYNKAGDIYAISTDEMSPHGETIKELKSDFRMMQKALNAPILDYDMEFAEMDRKEGLAKRGA